jgi:hypothetical protein|tara:strand:+ start:214 stop:534 length:321 start_codon:yes stop_codon:yes gene_type:complete
VKKEDIRHYIEINYFDEDRDGILLADGFEDAFMGIVESFGSKPKALYDSEKCIDVLMERDGMNYQDAMEFFSFNVEQAYVGEYTPAFFEPLYALGERGRLEHGNAN